MNKITLYLSVWDDRLYFYFFRVIDNATELGVVVRMVPQIINNRVIIIFKLKNIIYENTSASKHTKNWTKIIDL
jgi:hypothetical protein